MTQSGPEAVGGSRDTRSWASSASQLFQLAQNIGVLLLLVLVVVVVSSLNPAFLSLNNLGNVVVNASILAVVGFGMTIAIAMRGIDLSVGSIQAVGAAVVATLVADGSILVAIGAALLAGAVIGAVNGFVISKFQIPAFVATLGMMSIARGAALLFTGGESLLVTNEKFTSLNSGDLLGLPIPFVIALGTLLVLWVTFKHTPFGRHVAATGGNESAAVASGLNVDRITILVFTIVGLTAALSGVMVSAQVGAVSGSLGVGLELNVIAIAVLGGTSLSGGTGNLPGTLLAALLVSSISSALNILDVAAFYQYLAVGLLLIIALALDTLRQGLLPQAGGRTRS